MDNLLDGDLLNIIRESQGDSVLRPLREAAQRELFHRLYSQWFSRLLGLLISRGVESSTAQDCVQEAFIKVLTGQCDLGRNPFCWLCRVCINLSTDCRRRDRRCRPLDTDDGDGTSAASQSQFMDRRAPTAVELAVAEESAGELEEALNQLSKEERAVLECRCIEGLSRKDAAVVLGISTASLDRLLRSARTKLQTHLTAAGIALPPRDRRSLRTNAVPA